MLASRSGDIIAAEDALADAFVAAQRLVRAKKQIKSAGIPFVVPEPEVYPDRMDAVPEAVYGAHVVDWLAGMATSAKRRSSCRRSSWTRRPVIRRPRASRRSSWAPIAIACSAAGPFIWRS
ncbi:MAG: hypothetical protein AAFP13_11990 [Pseudomonadota bacterium]